MTTQASSIRFQQGPKGEPVINPTLSKPAIILLVLLTVCPSDTKPMPAIPVAPVVVFVSPANGTTGVRANTKIVLTFSKPMDRALTQAAYQSTDLPTANVTFTWDASDTVMTIKPNAALEYAKGTTIGIEAKRYTYRLTGTASDNTGMVLAAVSSGFSTLREITATLQSEALRDGFVQNNGLAKSDGTAIFAGDDATKVGIRGFLSFDLSGVPGGLSASSFLRATLSLYKYEVIGNPYTALNPCVPSNTTVCASKYVPVNLDHVVYGSSLNATDYDTPPLETLSIPSIPLDRLKIMKDKIYRNDGVFNSIDALQHAVPFEVSIEVRSVDDKNQAAVGAVTALLEFTNLEVARFALHTEGNEV